MPNQPQSVEAAALSIRHSTFGSRHFKSLVARPAVGLALAAIVPLILYLLLLNPYWVRYGDSEVMLGIARSLARGQGFKCNGQPIGVVPPGWPAVLALAMKFSTTLRTLKLLPIASLVGFLVLSYDVLLHLTRRRVALGCVLVTAVLQPVFSLSTLFFSDPLFCFLAAAWLCVALRIGTTRHYAAMLTALLALAVATIAVRWAGAAWFLLVAAAIFHRESIRLCWSRRWLAVGLCAVTTVATFFVVRRVMYVDPKTLDWRYAIFLQGTYDLFNIKNLLLQLQYFGLWLSGLFWAPSMLARMIRVPAEVIGCAVFVVIALGSWRAVKQRQWLLAGATLYTFALAANWPNPIPRYLVPAAPLLLLAGWQGLMPLRRWHLRTLLVASVVLVNVVLYGNEVRIMRSAKFYTRFQGGGSQSLIDATLALHAIDNGRPILISAKYFNFDRRRTSDGFRRALNFLIDRPVMTDEHIYGEPTDHVLRMLAKRKVGWYLYCPPTKTFLHMDYNDGAADTHWRLYRIKGMKATRIKLPRTHDWPTHVPQW